MASENPSVVEQKREIHCDGEMFIGEDNWQAMSKSEYLAEPLSQNSYITSRALMGLECELSGEMSNRPVAIGELDGAVCDWLGGSQWSCEITIMPVRLLPDDNPDIVTRLTKLYNVKFRVVESTRNVVVLGADVLSVLDARKGEDLTFGERSPADLDEVALCLEELLEAARLQGLTAAGLKRADGMVRGKTKDVWRLRLGPDDVADLPAMPVELKAGAAPLPKPYMRRYTAAEMAFWSVSIKEMLEAGIIRRSTATEVSPSNLVGKKVDGKLSETVFRTIIDLRERNKSAKDIFFAIPKLDECIHVLNGAECFDAGDKTKGYFQVLLEASARKFMAFVCPLGVFEYCRLPIGFKNSAAWFHRCMQTILEQLMFHGLLQYIDDTLLYGKNEDELLDRLDAYFDVMLKHNVKLHPGKFTLFAKKLKCMVRQGRVEGRGEAAAGHY